MNNKKTEAGMWYNPQHSEFAENSLDDPRIVALVRFIARCAADRDYDELLRALGDDEDD